MLSKEENELLCRTGPGTPMGRVVPRRRYRVEAPIVERGARSAGRTGAIGAPLRRHVSRAPNRESDAP